MTTNLIRKSFPCYSITDQTHTNLMPGMCQVRVFGSLEPVDGVGSMKPSSLRNPHYSARPSLIGRGFLYLFSESNVHTLGYRPPAPQAQHIHQPQFELPDTMQ